MIDTYLQEFEEGNAKLYDLVIAGKVSFYEYIEFAIRQLEVITKACPEDLKSLARLAECLHLEGNLRRAGEKYRAVMEAQPPEPLTEEEARLVRKFCPILMLNERECFPLKDIVAIHHPTRPLIGYHLFWEDDYDFPDDCEPCDHEEVWIAYDPEQEVVTNVSTFFHSRVIQSDTAVQEAQTNQQRAIIRIEWGKHGSLLKGWEDMVEDLTGQRIIDWMKETYEHVSRGGRVPEHPLKRLWPKGYEGSFEEYLQFPVVVDPLEWLERKPHLFKSEWVNATIFTQCLLYNFHPKMEWPDRYGTNG